MLTLLSALALSASALAGEIQWAQMTGRSGFLAVGTSRIDGSGVSYIDNGAPVFVSGDYLRYVNIDWTYTYGQPSLVKMKISGGDKCLDAGLTPGNGTPLKVWDCYEGYEAQTWKVHDGRIELVGKGLCVDVKDGVKPWQKNPAPQLQLWQCTGGPNQEWDPVCP